MCSEECAGEKRCDNPDTLDPWLLVTCQLSCVNVDVSYPRRSVTPCCKPVGSLPGLYTQILPRRGKFGVRTKEGRGRYRLLLGLAHVHKSLSSFKDRLKIAVSEEMLAATNTVALSSFQCP